MVATLPFRKNSFVGGEIAPTMYARTDNVKYETGVRRLRNMIVMKHGGVTMRPGTQYIATAQNASQQVRLIPFIFNETGVGQSYVLEFGNLYIGFYQNGGVVVNSGFPYTITSPYLQADLATLQFAQTADIVTITHPSYAPMELKRLGATNWTISAITFGPQQGAPTGPTAIGGNATLGTCYYVVTAISASTNEESNASSPAITTVGVPDSAHVVAVAWGAPSGTAPAYYNIYRSAGPNGSAGFIGTSQTANFSDTGISPNFSNTPPITPSGLFSGTGNYPSTVGFVQQRRGFANTNNNPIGFWLSQPGDFYNFNASVPPLSSDSIFSSIAGEEVNAIQHMVELKFMLLLTAGAEINVQGNGSGVVTPSSINASVQSSYGSSPLKPLKVGDAYLFNQALGSFIRDLVYDFTIAGFHGNDITIFASHLFEGYQIVDWAYQKVPDSIIWGVRSDGVLLACTYLREQQVLAWSWSDLTNGTVENVCAIPENGEYAVYLSVKRTINGSTVRYIERISSRIWSDEINATYLDCFASYNGLNTTGTTMTLTVPGGGAFSTASTAYQQSLTLTASVSTFTNSMVGHEIVMNDLAFTQDEAMTLDPITPVGVGNIRNYGNQIRCLVQSVQSSTVATVTPNRAVPTDLQNTAITTWSHAVKTLSGLNYLIGQRVSVWADRFVVGSPLNSGVSTVYTVAVDGTLTLDKCYSVIYVGLPMKADLETLDMETKVGESMLGSRKRPAKLAIYLQNTRSFFAGTENPDSNYDNTAGDALFQLFEEKRGEKRQTYDEPPELITDQSYVHLDTRWNKGGRIFIRNVDPIPLTILAVSAQGEDKVQSPFYKTT